jgi:hypothetical protein
MRNPRASSFGAAEPEDGSWPGLPDMEPGTPPEQMAQPQVPVEQPRQPAGSVTTVLRTRMPDKTSADYLGGLITSSEITESMIDAELAEHLQMLSAQDELIEGPDGTIVGLRLTTVPRATR